MNLSIIIPTYKTRELTLCCVRRIREHPIQGPYEIIVVDNNSQDGTVESITQEYPDVLTIQNSANLGFSKACNLGAAKARGRYLLFLNSDTEAKADTFKHLCQWLDEHQRTGIVGPELLGPAGEIQQMSWVWHPLLHGEFIQQYFAPYVVRRSRFRQKLIRYLQRRSDTVPSMCGACLMIRRSLFEELGGFDNDFELYFEDSDLCLRCQKAGWKIDFVAESKIIHRLGHSTTGSWTITSLIYQQSHLTFYRKHSSALVVSLLKGYLFVKWLRLKLVTWLKEPTPRAQAYCRAYFDVILERKRLTLEDGFPL